MADQRTKHQRVDALMRRTVTIATVLTLSLPATSIILRTKEQKLTKQKTEIQANLAKYQNEEQDLIKPILDALHNAPHGEIRTFAKTLAANNCSIIDLNMKIAGMEKTIYTDKKRLQQLENDIKRIKDGYMLYLVVALISTAISAFAGGSLATIKLFISKERNDKGVEK